MKSHSIIYLVLTILLLSLISCKEESSTEPDATKSLIPLAKDNIWTYDYATNLGDYTRVLEVESEVSDNIYKINYATRNKRNTEDSHYYTVVGENKSDGYYVDGDLHYKYPVETGDVFQRDGTTVTVNETNISITVPAGTFNCIEYEYDVSTYWVSPEVGLIKWKKDEWNHSELISYTLN